MSKLKCHCGHTISDVSNNRPYKADFLPDENREDFLNDIVKIIKSFNDAKESGQRDNWIKENFTVPPYPTDLPDQEMIWDLIHNSFIEKTGTMFQCDSCGRILIQRGQTDNFTSFKPETKDFKEMLRKS
jgi:hypothetical protein